MRFSSRKLLGGSLLAAALLLLVFAPRSFSVINFYAFLACFVLGFLMLQGLVGPDARLATCQPAANALNRPFVRVPTEIFRYPPLRPLVWAFFVFLALLMFAFGVLMAWGFRHQAPAERILAPALPLGFAIWLPLYLQATQRQTIRVDDIGLELHKWPRPVAIRWHEVAILSHRVYLRRGVPVAHLYEVLAPHKKIVVTDRLADGKHLRSTIAQATGLEWS